MARWHLYIKMALGPSQYKDVILHNGRTMAEDEHKPKKKKK